jgi:uncharacterized membrane protein
MAVNPAGLLGDVSLERPGALYLLIVVGAILLWSELSVGGSARRMLAPAMRAVALALFVLALAGPTKVVHRQGAAPPIAIDLSASITPAMRQWDDTVIGRELKLRPGDPAIVFGAASVATNVGQATAMLKGAGGCEACKPGATDLEGALTRLSTLASARGGSVVLFTDGWQNRGEAARAIAALRSAGVRLYIFTPPGAMSVPNVATVGLLLPSALSKAAPFALGVTMENFNPAPVGGAIRVYRNGALAAERRVTLAPGQERFDFPVHSENAGLDSYKAVFTPDNPALDQYSEDDSLQGWVGVGAQRKVLILSPGQRDANYLEAVVRHMGLKPEVVSLARGQWNGTPKGYDAVILNGVASSRLSPAAQNALVSYVDQGGSLAMTGSDASFGLGGWYSSPIARVMPVVMPPPAHKELKRALVLVIDKSGSMGLENKLAYAKAAAKTVTRTLKPGDLLGVIGFDSQPFVVVPLEPLAKSRPYLDEMIDRLKAQGSTYLLPALQEVDRSLARSGATSKHVVILTDGETHGTADMYYSLVSSMHHDEGASISAIAIGRQANFTLLQAIAKYGGGAYYQTDKPTNLPEIVLKDFKAHGGRTTMVEKEFTPHITAPNQVLTNMGGRAMPPLKGYVETRLKDGASLDMYVNRDGRRDPVLASWKYARGKTLALTTDASGRWSGPWIAGNAFAPVWDRILSWMTPRGAVEQKVDVALGYQRGTIQMKLADYSTPSAMSSHLVTVLVTRPGGSKTETPLSLEAPGELSGSIEAEAPGTYYLEVRSPGLKGRLFPPLAYTVSAAAGAEIPRPAPDYGLLEQLASATGGRLNPSPAEVELRRPMLERRASLDPYIVLAAMILLIAEAALRRLAA